MSDNSKQFIKMCNCPEIQDGHKWELRDQVYFRDNPYTVVEVHLDFIGITLNGVNKDIKYIGLRDGVWLPRQGQLQGMVWDYWNQTYSGQIKALFITRSLKELAEFHANSSMFRWMPDRSMNQLWLAFVMWELHEKKWSGERWINES